MKHYIIIFLISISAFANAQNKINTEIQNELIQIDKDDQTLRKIFFIKDIFDAKKDSLTKYYHADETEVKEILKNQIKKNDSLNMIKIDRIIQSYGYPGKSLVGEKASIIAWEVIQHSNNPKKYIDVLKTSAENHEIDYHLYAMTLDRVLMVENKPQMYGSQAKNVTLKKTKNSQLIIWPIENPKEVNKRRKTASFPETNIKKYAKQLGIKYKTYNLDDIVM